MLGKLHSSMNLSRLTVSTEEPELSIFTSFALSLSTPVAFSSVYTVRALLQRQKDGQMILLGVNSLQFR